MEHAKSAKSPISGCSLVQQVHILFLLTVLEVKGTSLSPYPRSLSTAVLSQTTGKLPKHHASTSIKSRDVFDTADFTATSLEPALASNSTLSDDIVSEALAPYVSLGMDSWRPLSRKKEKIQ